MPMQTGKLLGLIGSLNVNAREQRKEADARIAALEVSDAEKAKQIAEIRNLLELLIVNMAESAKQ